MGHHGFGESIFLGLIMGVFWIGVILPIKACIIAGQIAIFLLRELLSGGKVMRLVIMRRYLLIKRRLP